MLSYDNATNKLTYTDEAGTVNTISLTNLVQNNQKTSSVTSGTYTTVATTTPTTNNTDYKVDVDPLTLIGAGLKLNATTKKIDVDVATATTTGAVKPGSGLAVAADGTLSVNIATTGGIGKTLSPADGSIVIGGGPGATLVDANVKVADKGITIGKLADAPSANQVLVSDANKLPVWVDQTTVAQNALTFINGTNTTLSGTGSATTPYKYDVAIGSSTTLGVVKQAASNATVNIAADGVLSVNTTNVAAGLGKKLTGSGITVTAGTVAGTTTNVANSVLADVTLGIADNAVTTAKIADGAVIAGKLSAGTGTAGRVGIADVNGAVTYGVLPASSVTGRNLTPADGSIAIGGGGGATLVDANVKVADGGISNVKLAANAVSTDKILDATILDADIANSTITAAKLANSPSANQVLVSNGSSVPTWINQSTIASSLEPWRVQGTTTGAILNTDNIYQNAKVAIGADLSTPALLSALSAADASAKLFVNGTITTANSLYADYVFEDYFEGASKLNTDYTFKSLKEIEEFINKNKHLPGVTGIKGLAKNEKGEYVFNISKLSVQLLEKVEELYLHTIEQQKQLEAKDKEIQDLKAQQQKNEERLKRLEEAMLGKGNK